MWDTPEYEVNCERFALPKKTLSAFTLVKIWVLVPKANVKQALLGGLSHLSSCSLGPA